MSCQWGCQSWCPLLPDYKGMWTPTSHNDYPRDGYGIPASLLRGSPRDSCGFPPGVVQLEIMNLEWLRRLSSVVFLTSQQKTLANIFPLDRFRNNIQGYWRVWPNSITRQVVRLLLANQEPEMSGTGKRRDSLPVLPTILASVTWPSLCHHLISIFPSHLRLCCVFLCIWLGHRDKARANSAIIRMLLPSIANLSTLSLIPGAESHTSPRASLRNLTGTFPSFYKWAS